MLSFAQKLLSSGDTRAQQWLLRDCDSNHPTCHPAGPAGPAFRPTRLIDLREYPQVYLAEKLDPGIIDLRYAALSYTWGLSMPDSGKTTSANLETHQRSIDIDKLPRTVKDAIDFTHNLAIPFLWVDALCIIQDDKSDWEREAATMDSVYSKAYLTIAAASSDHCDGGFLQTSYDKYEIPEARKVQMSDRQGDVSTEGAERFNYAMNLDLQAADQTRTWVTSFTDNPLFSRSWTLQERELSSRILHFTRTHVVWECRQSACAYIRPRKSWVLTEPTLMNMYPDHRFGFQPSGRALPKDPTPLRFETWHKIVENYSRRKLTVPSDKILAIAGVAKALQSHIGSDYLAGLWRANLINDLLWHRKGDAITHGEQDPTSYYAPSWSWAWTNFPIVFLRPDNVEKIDAKILEGFVPRSRVESGRGYIKLKAKVLEVSTEHGANLLLDSGVQHYNKRPETRRNGVKEFTICILMSKPPTPEKWDFYWRDDNHGTLIPAAPGRGLGLALRRVEGIPSTYLRIGYAEDVSMDLFDGTNPDEITII
ncbi:heterokaryon incompatibility protein-domain-containing protein [Hyaloscypha sp. PMI_1271]|nr:heterokaryon incompatibility protein-domain-containing protein [Hyaloscypha sp. PMI_1271]